MRQCRPLLSGLAAIGLLALGACGSDDSTPDKAEKDSAALALAVAAPMMSDLDLVSRNDANSAIAGGGPPVVVLPPYERGGEAVAAAKADAEKLAGGAIAAAASPTGELNAALRDGATALQRAAAIRAGGRDCSVGADFALAWSLKLPESLPIYPRGHLVEAAGSDADGCRLRVVRFVSPVEPQAIIDFYAARGRGFTLRHAAEEDLHQLSGSKGAARFAVQARKRDDGLTEADLAVSGL